MTKPQDKLPERVHREIQRILDREANRLADEFVEKYGHWPSAHEWDIWLGHKPSDGNVGRRGGV